MSRVLLIFLVVFSTTGRADAATAAAIDGVDMMIVVDQSASMGAGDPSGQRAALAREIILRLAYDAYDKGRSHRVGVVDFGSDVEDAVGMLVVEAPKNAPYRVFATAAAAAGGLRVKNLSYTDTPKALAAAIGRLSKLPPSARRPRAVVLLTDGRPDRRSFKGFPSESEGMLRVMREELQASVSPLLSGNQVHLWVVGLDEKGAFWNTPMGAQIPDGLFWAGMTGDPGRAFNAGAPFPDLVRAADRIVDGVLGGRGILVGNALYAATPYLRRLTFWVRFKGPRGPVAVEDPAGVVVAPLSGAAAAAHAGFNLFEVIDPKPGEYRVTGAAVGRDMDVTVRALGPTAALDGPSSVHRDAPTQLALTLGGGAPGSRMPIDPAWPIKGVFQTTGPGGREDLPFRTEASGRLVADWLPRTPGRHFITPVAVFTTPQGEEIDLFQSDAPTPIVVVVSEHPPLVLTVDRPTSGEIAVWPWDGGVSVEAHLEEGLGKRIADPASVVANPAGWLSFQLLDADGSPIGDPVPATLENGAFRAEIPVEFDYWRGEGWLGPVVRGVRATTAGPPSGGRTLAGLAVSPDGSSVGTPPAGAPPAGTPPVGAPSVAPDRMTLTGLEIGYPVWLAPVLGGLSLAALFGAVWAAYMARRPYERIRRADRGRSGKVALVVYDAARGPVAGPSTKSLSLTGRYRAVFRRVIQISAAGRKAWLLKLECTRLDVDGGTPQLQVRYRLEDSPKTHTQRLKPGVETELRGAGPDASWVMKFEAPPLKTKTASR